MIQNYQENQVEAENQEYMLLPLRKIYNNQKIKLEIVKFNNQKNSKKEFNKVSNK